MAAVADNSGEVAVANGNNNLVVETSKSESKEFNAQKLVDMFTKLNPLAKEFFPSSYHYNPTKTGDFNQAPVNKQGNKNFPNRRITEEQLVGLFSNCGQLKPWYQTTSDSMATLSEVLVLGMGTPDS
ncbi:hypothetical protein GOBAR_DD35335 [Gossypium barbadense]|nr:hypothetical protein GOBAR_DD35335 [Gossypium barbadense]